MKEEKVCLTEEQIWNLGEAHAAEYGIPDKTKVCPKALSWVQKFFGKGKRKTTGKKKREVTADEMLEKIAEGKIKSKLNAWLDGLF